MRREFHLSQFVLQLVGYVYRFFVGLRLRQHQGELVTAEARQNVGMAYGVTQAAATSSKESVTGLVTAQVVDMFELIGSRNNRAPVR